MKKQKWNKIVGFALMIGAIMYMVYQLIKDTDGDTDYIVYGMCATVVGMFLAEYGSDKEKK